jgi:hypothetical protein
LGGLTIMPWPFIIVGILGFPVLGVVAALRGARNGAMPSWFVIVFVVAAGASTAGALGQDTRNSEWGPMLIGAMGLAALALAWLAFSSGRTDAPEASPA